MRESKRYKFHFIQKHGRRDNGSESECVRERKSERERAEEGERLLKVIFLKVEGERERKRGNF